MHTNPCSKCGKESTFKFTRIEKGTIYDIYLCDDHASQLSPYQQPLYKNISDVLAGLLKQDPGIKVVEGGVSPADAVRCRRCGITFAQYRKTLLLGCSECYTSFHDLLIAELRKFHGGVRHTGRKPGGGFQEPAVEGSGVSIEAAEAPVISAISPTMGAGALIDNLERAVQQLEGRLRQAIEGEDYEKAAQLRDQIRELREQVSGH